MKRKNIIISMLITIMITISIIIFLNDKNKQKYINYDGMILALTLDEEEITEFPEDANYTVKIDCGDTAMGKWIYDEENKKYKLAIEEISGKVKCNIDFYTRKESDKLTNVVQNVNSTNNNGYRYQGKEPDNWVWFNNELWRIIGSVPVCIEASNGTCSKRENRIKIIRSSSIGGLVYDASSDSTYTGVWGSNSLYNLLNNYYLGRANGTGSAYCYGYKDTAVANCDYTKIGIKFDDSYGQMLQGVYWNIGGANNSDTATVAYSTEIASVTKEISIIGLMSASDYGYATLGVDYSSIALSSYNTKEITQANWLFGQGREWTNIQRSGNSKSALFVNYNGAISYQNTMSGGYNIRPATYLNPEVYIISGTGTELDPYIIGM